MNAVNKLLDLVRREPARVYAVLVALFPLLTALGIAIDPTTAERILAFAATLIGLAAGEAVRRRVTPVKKRPRT